MQQILEEKLNKIIKEKEFKWGFEIEKEGIYGIEITALAKSWQQNFLKSFFQDDNLTVEIDNLNFLKEFVNWNGNNLKGLKKTNFFIIKLSQRNHSLFFLASQNPRIETIRIYKIEDDEISYLSKDNYPIQEGNRRQWLTIILGDLGLQFLKIKASAKQGKTFLFFPKDDSDLKLIINGKIQENQEPKSHKNWYWCGNTLKGNSKIFKKELNLKPDFHYLEFWADRNPEVEEIKIKIETKIYPIFTLKDIQIYTYKGVLGNEDYNRFDQEILEAVNLWNKFFFSQKYPPKESLDSNLVKAMIYIESRMGYEKNGFPDVMQAVNPEDPAIHVLNNDGQSPSEYDVSSGKLEILNYQGKANGNTSKESIFWGVRWLYHKLQLEIIKENDLIRPDWGTWKQAVKRYGPGTDEYLNKVWNLYKNGIGPDKERAFEIPKENQGFSKIFSLIFIATIITLIGSTSIFYYQKTKFCYRPPQSVTSSENSIDPEIYKYKKIENLIDEKMSEYLKGDKNYWGDIFKKAKDLCQKEKCYGELISFEYLKKLVKGMRDVKQFIEAVGFLYLKPYQWESFDIDQDQEEEIVFLQEDILGKQYIFLNIIDKNEEEFHLIQERIEESYFNSPDSILYPSRPLKLLDLTGDAVPEILLFLNSGRYGAHLHVFEYKAKNLQKIFYLDEFKYPEYIFTDANKNLIPEIIIKGVDVKYEYQKENNKIKKINIR